MERSEYHSPRRLDSTSSRLLERLSDHDPEAWRQFVRLYGPVVRYWIRRSGLTSANVADVFQDVFLSVSSSVAAFERQSGTGKFRAWLKAVTQSKIADHFRRQGKQPLAFGGSVARERLEEVQDVGNECSSDATTNDDDALSESEETFITQRTLRLVRSEFREKTWNSFWRTAVDGRSSREVAAELGTTAVAVRKAKSRILQRLRKALAGDHGA